MSTALVPGAATLVPVPRAYPPAVVDEVKAAALDRLAMTREPGWLAAFVKRAWSIIDPDPLVWNWHYSLLCWELERVAAGTTRELVISVPPGTGKSILVAALFPAALWLRDPGCKVLAIAHVPKNVTRDSRRHRDVVQSAWYRGLVETLAEEEGIGLVEQPDGTRVPWTLSKDQNEKVNFENTARGSREVGSVGGGITGTRCRGLIVDDPYNAVEATDGTPAQVAERMRYVVDQYDSNWKNRVHARKGWRVTIMQGLAEGDLADVLVKRGVRRVILPMIAEPEVTVRLRAPTGERDEKLYHPRDPRKPGELLFPWLYSAEYVREFRSTPGGARVWLEQYMQRRATLGGRLFPREYFGDPPPKVGVQRYRGAPERLAKGLDNIAITVDCTFDKTDGSDRVSVQAWGWQDDSTHRFLLDRVSDRMDISGTIAAVIAMRGKWHAIKPVVRFVLIEKKANGAAVLTLFDGRVPNAIPYTPKQSKYGRAQVTSYAMQAGCIWYPESDAVPWIGEVVEQHVKFTGEEGGQDDDVDAESQFLIFLDDQDAEKPEDAIARIKGRFGFLKRPR